MAKIYYQLIKKGLRTISQVPTLLQAQVQILLDTDKEEENNG